MTGKGRVLIFLFFMVGMIASSLQGDVGQDADIDMIMDQMIPLRDGVHLSARIWMPEEIIKPLPAIFCMTPYDADEGQQRGVIFARSGYIYVLVDCRGRGNSEGEFLPNQTGGGDAADVIAWVAEQPWCNGQVVMRGGSYRGWVQWQAIKERPAKLLTIVPTAAAYVGIDFPRPNNIFMSYMTRWIALVSGKPANWNLFNDAKFWLGKYYAAYKKHLPFEKLAEFTGSNQKYFERWIAHPSFDDFWQSIAPRPEDYQKISIPILTITGHFDTDQPGAMTHYREHMKYGNPEAKDKHFLVIGPWNHAGTRYPTRELEGLAFGENSLLDMERLHVAWYDWWLKDKAKPDFLKKRVCYYVLNADEWKYADRLEDVSNGTARWYLSSHDGEAHEIFHSGSLGESPPPAPQRPDVITNDPLKLMPQEDYLERGLHPSYLDQSRAYAEDKLIYHSAPLSEALEVAGYMTFKAFLELNVPDADLGVSVYEIKGDGRSVFLGEHYLRARYRKSAEQPELVSPGKVELYEFKDFYFFARKLDKGSRLRLIVYGLNSPDWEKNYNSGGVISRETAKDARTAMIKLYHDSKYPSVLELPVKK